MKAFLLSLVFFVSIQAQAQEFACRLTKGGASFGPGVVHVDASQLREFVETMESMGVTVKCSPVQDA